MRKKIILGLLISFNFSFALDPDAVTLYNQFKANYGSKDGIRRNITKPATGTAEYRTLDGSQSFSAPVSCPSQEKAVVISFSTAGGNDYVATIYQDLNLDGQFDYTYTTPNISGVCTNGIISCQAGTWNNCKYFYWRATDKKISLVETLDTSKTGSCACTNISCGINTLDQPLFSQIGGGIAQAIAKEDSRFVVSKSKWNGTSLELYGQDSMNCSDYQAGLSSYGNQNPVNYYNSQTPPSVSISDVALQQENDPYSPYSIVSEVQSYEYEPGEQIGIPDKQECIIRNIVSAQKRTFYENCTDKYTDENGETWCIVASDKKVISSKSTCKDCSPLEHDLSSTVNIKYNQKWAVVLKIANLTGDRGRYWIRKVDNDGVTVVDDVYKTYSTTELTFFQVLGTSSSISETHEVYAYQKANAWGKNHKYPPGWGEILILKSLTYSDDEFSVSITDTCPSNCELLNEWVCDKDGNNCVQTIRDGAVLDVQLLKQCYELTSSITTYTICSDGNSITATNQVGTKTIGNGWFYIKREYNCGTQNIDVDISRFKNVVESSQIDSSGKIVTYTDLGQTETADLSNIPSESCLTPVCTVKIPKTDTAVFSDNTNRFDTAAGTDSFELEIRTCSKNGSVMTCPVNAGEELVEDCKCDIGQQRAGFQTAVTSLQVLNEASKDMICSSSPP
ncbi:hypothetical protein [Persephonella sp.]